MRKLVHGFSLYNDEDKDEDEDDEEDDDEDKNEEVSSDNSLFDDNNDDDDCDSWTNDMLTNNADIEIKADDAKTADID